MLYIELCSMMRAKSTQVEICAGESNREAKVKRADRDLRV